MKKYFIILLLILCPIFSCSNQADTSTQAVLDLLGVDLLPPLEFKKRLDQALNSSGDQELIALMEQLTGLIGGGKAVNEFQNARKEVASKLGVDPDDLTGLVTKPLDLLSGALQGATKDKSLLKPEEAVQLIVYRILASFLKSHSDMIKEKGLKKFLIDFLGPFLSPTTKITSRGGGDGSGGSPRSSPGGSGSSDAGDGGLRIGACVFQQFKPEDFIARTMGVTAELYGEIVNIEGNMIEVYWNCQNAYAAEETDLGNQFLGKTTKVPAKYLSACSSKGYTSIADAMRGNCR